MSDKTGASVSSGDDDATVVQRVMTTGPGKSTWPFPERGLCFSSHFDGGNMATVDLTPSGAFDVQVSEDAAAFGISTGYSTWFYFEVERNGEASRKERGTKQGQDLNITLVNLNAQSGLFKNGYTIMYSSLQVTDKGMENATPVWVFLDELQWQRLPTPLKFEKFATPSVGQKMQRMQVGEKEQRSNQDDNSQATARMGATTLAKMRVSFAYTFKYDRERVRFAFCYPYTYTRLQKELVSLDNQFMRQDDCQLESQCLPGDLRLKNKTIANVYYHRELLTRSLEGLRIDLVTISSMDGIPIDQEPSNRKFGTIQSEKSSKSAFSFDPKQKKMVVISARVHPAETPANFMLDGMLQLLLHPTDESAIALRRHFVFKIVPMLNPDGVCQGFYRTDTRGVNVNRVYENPQPELAPAAFALKKLLLQCVEDYGGANSTSARENMVYLDLHAHANRRGCFVLGNNHLPDSRCDRNATAMKSAFTRQVQTQLYARLVDLHTPFFDYTAYLFDKKSMTRRDLRDNNNATTSRQGSSRVALYRATGLTYVYTIECNYNEGRRHTGIASSPSSKGTQSGFVKHSLDYTRPLRRTVPARCTRQYLKYSPAAWKDVGIGALIALLDLFNLIGAGPCVNESSFRSCDAIKKKLLEDIAATLSSEVVKVSQKKMSVSNKRLVNRAKVN